MEGRLQASQQELASAKLAHGAELAKHMTVRMQVLATASRPSLRMQVLATAPAAPPTLLPPPSCPLPPLASAHHGASPRAPLMTSDDL
jgi:hypothetical protein